MSSFPDRTFMVESVGFIEGKVMLYLEIWNPDVGEKCKYEPFEYCTPEELAAVLVDIGG